MVLNIGPQHPSTHGVLRLRLVLDGERIQHAEPVIGYMHRGAEKLFEARDYRQIIMLANRHDWLSAFSNELGVVMAVERMLGMEVPERAVWTADAARRAEPRAEPPDVPRLVPAGAGRYHPRLPRLPGARGAPGRHGGDLRRPDALHVQPGRRPQGGPAGGLARPGPARRRRCPLPDGRLRQPGPGQRDLPRPYPRRRRARAGDGACVRGLRADRPRLRCRLRPAARRAVSGVRGAAVDAQGRHPRGGRLPGPLRVPAGAEPQRARPRRRLPGPDRGAAARARSTSGCPRC